MPQYAANTLRWTVGKHFFTRGLRFDFFIFCVFQFINDIIEVIGKVHHIRILRSYFVEHLI